MNRKYDNDLAINRDFSIGKIAAQTGTKVETVRYYEHEGLMPEPPRSSGGHRIYNGEHLKRLNFIRRSRELGFTLDQIRGLLRFVDNQDYSCEDVRLMTLEHLTEVRQKIADLTRIENMLDEMAQHCDGGDIPDCPIIDTLFEACNLTTPSS